MTNYKTIEDHKDSEKKFCAYSLPNYPLDTSESLLIEYPESIKVLLLSTPGLKNASFCLAVEMGDSNDPYCFSGIPQLLQGYLLNYPFIYSGKSSFSDYLSSKSGSSAIFTNSFTSYFIFNVPSEGLTESFSVFTKLFRSNIDFYGSLISKEKIDARERSKDLIRLDTVAANYMLSREIKEDYAICKAKAGILDSLTEEEIASIIKKILTEHFNLNNMCLVINADQDIQKLKTLAEDTLGPFCQKNGNSEETSALLSKISFRKEKETRKKEGSIFKISDLYLMPETKCDLNNIFKDPFDISSFEKIEAIKFKCPEGHEKLIIYWSLEETISAAQENPISVIRRLFKIRSPGSLFSTLKKQGFLSDSRFSHLLGGDNFHIIYFEFFLTEEGLKEVDKVLACIFSWLCLLDDVDREKLKAFYSETKVFREIESCLVDPQKSPNRSVEIASNLSRFTINRRDSNQKKPSAMPYKDLLLTYELLIKKVDIDVLKDLLAQLTDVRRIKIFISSNHCDGLLETTGEPFHIKFKRHTLTLSEESKYLAKLLKFPKGNEYIASPSMSPLLDVHFELSTAPKQPSPGAKLIFPTPPSHQGQHSFYLTDNHFRAPTNVIRLAFLNNYSNLSIKNRINSQLLVNLLTLKLNEIAADTKELKTRAEVQLEEKGVTLTIKAVNWFLERFMEDVLNTIINYKIAELGVNSKTKYSEKSELVCRFINSFLLDKIQEISEFKSRYATHIYKNIFLKGSFWAFDHINFINEECEENMPSRIDENHLFFQMFRRDLESIKANLFSIRNGSFLFYAHGRSSVNTYKAIESKARSSLCLAFDAQGPSLPILAPSTSLKTRTKILKKGNAQCLSFLSPAPETQGNEIIFIMQIPPAYIAYINNCDTGLARYLKAMTLESSSYFNDILSLYVTDVFSKLLVEIFCNPFFSQLKGELSPATYVNFGQIKTGVVDALLYIVRSHEIEIEQLQHAILKFLLLFSEKFLDSISEEVFEKFKFSVIKWLKSPIESLDEHAEENWRKMMEDGFLEDASCRDLEKRKTMVEICKLVKKEDVHGVWKTMLEEKRILVIKLFKDNYEGIERLESLKFLVASGLKYEDWSPLVFM